MNADLWLILGANALSGVGGIVCAAGISYAFLSRVADRMVSLSVGLLLSTALLHTLPEAFDGEADHHALFGTLLAGLLGFFVLHKAALLRHNHHHEGDGHDHHHGHDAQSAGRAGWLVLCGDTLHNFADGVLIAAAFLADTQVGIFTSAAVIVHEIPQEVADFMVLLNAGLSRTRAMFYQFLSALAALLGGIVGYYLLAAAEKLLPFVLVLSASSFIYIAVSDLMPQMQRRAHLRDTLSQIGLIAFGVILVFSLTQGLHQHHH